MSQLNEARKEYYVQHADGQEEKPFVSQPAEEPFFTKVTLVLTYSGSPSINTSLVCCLTF